MLKYASLVILLTLSQSAFAHSVFTGTVKGTGAPCRFEVEQTYFEDNIESAANFRAEVAVSLEDGDHHKHNNDELTFIVKPSGKPNILSGVGANQLDQINILVAPGSAGLSNPVTVAIKWLHVNHYHTAQCTNLKLAEHE